MTTPFVLKDPKGHHLTIRSGGSGGSDGQGWACDACRDFYAPICTAFNCATCEYDLCFECAMKLTPNERKVLEALSDGVNNALYENKEAFDLDISSVVAAESSSSSQSAKEGGASDQSQAEEQASSRGEGEQQDLTKLDSSKLVLAVESTFPDISIVYKESTFHVDVREVLGAVFWDVGYGEDEDDEGDSAGEGDSGWAEKDAASDQGRGEKAKRNAEGAAAASSPKRLKGQPSCLNHSKK